MIKILDILHEAFDKFGLSILKKMNWQFDPVYIAQEYRADDWNESQAFSMSQEHHLPSELRLITAYKTKVNGDELKLIMTPVYRQNYGKSELQILCYDDKNRSVYFKNYYDRAEQAIPVMKQIVGRFGLRIKKLPK